MRINVWLPHWWFWLLISPYWNVNGNKVHAKYVTQSFNLSILECKCQQTSCQRVHNFSFNLSILECKYLSITTDLTSATPFNLSILECKCNSALRLVLSTLAFNLSILECK